jgi:hypothetical protein
MAADLEADALAAIVRDSKAFPQPDRARVRGAVDGAVPDRGSHAVLRAVEVDAPVEMLAAAYDRQR